MLTKFLTGMKHQHGNQNHPDDSPPAPAIHGQEPRKDAKPALRIFAISFGVLGALWPWELLEVLRNLEPPVLPQVVHTDVPYYPLLARAAHLEGAVRVRVTTDGLKVVVVHVEDGPKLLQEATEKTVQSWEFFKA